MIWMEGKVTTTAPFLAWPEGGELRMMSFTFNFQTREYWYHAVVPDADDAAVWPQVQAIIASAGIRQTRL